MNEIRKLNNEDENPNIELIKYYISNGVDLNIKYNDEENTPLMEAVIYGDLDLIKYMVEHGADVNAETLYYNVLLTADDKLQIIKYLIETGADVNRIMYGDYYNGLSYVDIVGKQIQCSEIVDFLVENNLVI